jgi:hypothetical protein
VRASSLLTRGSAIEHHCLVDCGTAIDNSTVLPFSEIGPGLDLCNAILGFQKITSLSRDATVEIEDPKLVRAISRAASVRLLAQSAEMIAYLPKQIWRGLSGVEIRQAPSIAETTNVDLQHYDAPRIGDCTRQDSKVFDPDLAVVRRYGNQ